MGLTPKSTQGNYKNLSLYENGDSVILSHILEFRHFGVDKNLQPTFKEIHLDTQKLRSCKLSLVINAK